jgi:hypothetical protein
LPASEWQPVCGGGTVLAEYTVFFTNLTGCAMGISDISWHTKVIADSEKSAIDLAVEQARVVNRKSGMPPHGIRLNVKSLRELAIVYGKSVPCGDSAVG